MKSISLKRRRNSMIFIILIVLVGIGIGGYFYWKSILAKPQSAATSLQDAAIAKKEEVNKAKDQPQAVTKDPDDGYLVLESWKVKMKIPDSMGEIVYYKKVLPKTKPTDVGTESYEFTTKRLEALGGRCIDSGASEAVRLGIISRAQTKPESGMTGPMFLNGGQPIGGYYYWVAYSQAACSMNGLDIQTQDRKSIGELFQSISII